MKIPLLLLVLALTPGAVRGSYSYDFTGLPPGTSWTANGAVDYDYSPGIDFYEDAGSFIYQPTVSGTNSNDYEVSMTVGRPSATVVEFLRASSDAMRGDGYAAGSFISVEYTAWSATIAVKQSVGGVLTQLGSVSGAYGGASRTLRSVVWGTTLWVFLDNQLVYSNTSIPATTGQPGIGGFLKNDTSCSVTMITSVSIGHHDIVPPIAPNQSDVRASILPTSVSLAWEGASDDSVGIGVYRYNISRNGTALTNIVGTPILTDSSVTSGSTYTYTISAVDYHGNATAPVSYTAVVPTGGIDPRRTGASVTGSYWGGGGEQIDTLSGNLNFSIPLVKPIGRTGWAVPVGLSYNSQNWVQDGSVNWSLGADTGYGYGWTLQIGSITPYYAAWTSGVDHYVFTDGSGASYRLDQNNSGIWTSLQGLYVWFDASTNKLHFKDGKFWVMGCVSSGGEQDAGTLYPTIMEDTIGNQIIATYQAGSGLPSAMTNTSARIVTIEDVRAGNMGGYPPLWSTYSFTYNTDPIPHLQSVSNHIFSGEAFPAFQYSTAALAPPFGTDSSYSGVMTTHLTGITMPAAGPTSSTWTAAGKYSFDYDSAGASELTKVTFPWGGHLRWEYATATYQGGRLLREITNRYLAADAGGSVEWGPYSFTHSDSGSTISTVHADTTLADASGVGAKKWTFTTSGSPWEIGLTAEFRQLSAVSGSVMTHDTYTWSQTPGSTVVPKIGYEPYISQKVHVIDEGTADAQSALTTQTEDAYGNLLTENIFPFNSTSSPLQAFQNSFSAAGYAGFYILDRLATSSVTVGGVVKPLVHNWYDGAAYTGSLTPPSCSGYYYFANGASGYRELDSTAPFSARGLVTNTETPGKDVCIHPDPVGNPDTVKDSNGRTVTLASDSGAGYTSPTTVTTDSYNYALSYNAWLGLSQSTGANGEAVAMSYDGYGRPLLGNSAYNNYTWFYYPDGTTSLPVVLPTYQKKVGIDGYTYTILDGLGRPAQVKRGDSAGGPKSYVSSVYTPCACSPLGKQQKTSQPYATSTAVAWQTPVTGDPLKWTSYTYDGIGRTLTMTQPDGISATTYTYAGNKTTVTDPNGNWKTFTSDVLGNLVSVVEADPCVTTNTLTTSYTYDWMNHLTGVTMTRPNVVYTSGVCSESGSQTQTRTFVYNDQGQLTSATNPESGTVTYGYGPDVRILSDTDHLFSSDSDHPFSLETDQCSPVKPIAILL